ncbi:MAG: hypothetical protein R6U56_03405, partial [Opitutales bacterium]
LKFAISKCVIESGGISKTTPSMVYQEDREGVLRGRASVRASRATAAKVTPPTPKITGSTTVQPEDSHTRTAAARLAGTLALP